MTKKLVIIDDSSTQLNILKTLFSKNGWEVCGVQNAKLGYEIIFDFAPDLIITDAIMPVMGGFQLIKLIRENEKISKIPVIVYSVLSETNAKFYIKEELSEYFLRKENNQDELLELAKNIVQKYPLDKEYKDEILRFGMQELASFAQDSKKEEETPPQKEAMVKVPPKEEFNISKFEEKIKKLSVFSSGDEKIISSIFPCLFEALDYDLCVFCIYSFEDKEKKAYFDIKNLILSPILRNIILNKYQAQIGSMHKKYSPHLNTLVSESEFLSKIEFNFEYKDETIANIAFYSREKSKWEDEEKNSSIKKNLYNFSKAHFIQKSSQYANKDDISTKYSVSANEFEGIKDFSDSYFGIIQIVNFMDISTMLSFEELDIINSKISEKIMECLEKNEQIYKNDEDEYSVVIFAKDKKHAYYRFEYILNLLKDRIGNIYDVELFIAACPCNIDNNFNIIEAQKNTRKIIDESNHQKDVVICDV